MKKPNGIELLTIQSFSQEELKATYQTFCGVIRADGTIHSAETQMLKELRELFNITDDIVVASRSYSFDQIVEIHRNMPDIKKAFLIKYMSQICFIDGSVHPVEESLVLNYAKLINCPDMF